MINEIIVTYNKRDVKVKVNDTFNKLTIKSLYEKRGKWYCDCVCECGKEMPNILVTNILFGIERSCGSAKCDDIENRGFIRKINGRSIRLHRIWIDMRRRCNNPNRKTSKDYYERGIKVCEEWDNYENFYYWAYEHGYDDTLTIERVDCSKGYNPENCTWIPNGEQSKNRDSFCHYLYWEDKKYTVTDLAKKWGINRLTFYDYLNRNKLPLEEIYEKHAKVKEQ